MSVRFRLDARCEVCEALAREWLEARQADLDDMRKRLFEAARSSDRDPKTMRDVWLSSIAKMPDEEMRTVMRAYDSRAAAARQKWRDHEAATGHAVSVLGSAVLLGYRFGICV
jgi:hypothetical protein